MTQTKAPAQRAHWHDAYDAQMALWRWYRTRPGVEWVAGVMRANQAEHDAPTREMIYRLWDGEMGRLLDCDPLYVSAEMCELIEVAYQSFQPEPLHETDLITPRGFLWLGRPIFIPDRYGQPLAVQAFSWAREYAAVSDKLEAAEAAIIEASLQGTGPRFTVEEFDAWIERGLIFPAGINVTLYAETAHYTEQAMARAPKWVPPATQALPVVPFHASPWHFGMTFDGNEIDLLGKETGMWEWWALTQTTLRLMQQRIATRHMGRLHRAHRREAKRLGLNYEPEVVVVRLRREAGERHEPSGEEANYSHRFIVSGHWRNQWYPTEKLHRQIWISPYVKGPEDKPLIVRPRRVYQWER